MRGNKAGRRSTIREERTNKEQRNTKDLKEIEKEKEGEFDAIV
jgi:hypothetical protein